MNLQRLRKMGITELAGRSRQEAAKWLDRMRAAGIVGWESDPDLTEGVHPDPGRFFEGAVTGQTPAILVERMPRYCEQAVAAADQICDGKFSLLGYNSLTFGEPVDWSLDPLSGRRAPHVHWSLLDRLQPIPGGDCKLVWELNRHQWMVHLGQAYRLTSSERYAVAFAGYIRRWMEANPPGMGINWASSLEAALRLISWCWSLFLFGKAKALDRILLAQIVQGISAHATYIERHLSYYFSPNTHLTGEALGLFYAGTLFPDLRHAGRWRRLGARILKEQSVKQVLPDGVYFEQATCYQRYTSETYLHFLALAKRNGEAIPLEIAERLERAIDFLLAIHQPDGTVPQIGDADGGALLSLAPRASEDLHGVFSTAAALLGRADYAWAAGELAPETIWMLGMTGAKAFEDLRPMPPSRQPSCLFPTGGYAVMRSGWGEKDHQMIFDVGPLGCPVSGGHGHADLLSVQCSIFGEPYLVDPGTGCYTAEPRWRDFFRSTAAHSTLMVDGAQQAAPAGPFAWKSRPRARLRRWLSSETLDLADASHEAYCTLKDPVVHRRRVVFIKPRYWAIVDDLMGAEEHSVELRFQLAPAMRVELDTALQARIHRSGGRGLVIRAFATAPLKAQVHEGETSPIQGWVSPAYGQRLPAPLLRYSTVTRLPVRIATVLLPAADLSDPIESIAPLTREGPSLMGLVFGDGREFLLIDDERIALERG